MNCQLPTSLAAFTDQFRKEKAYKHLKLYPAKRRKNFVTYKINTLLNGQTNKQGFNLFYINPPFDWNHIYGLLKNTRPPCKTMHVTE